MVTADIDSEEIQRIVSVVDTDAQILEVIQGKNNRLQDVYRVEVEKHYDAKAGDSSLPYHEEQLQTDLKQCMAFGVNAIKKALDLGDQKLGDTKTADSRQIEKVKTWQEIKRDMT